MMENRAGDVMEQTGEGTGGKKEEAREQKQIRGRQGREGT